MMNADEMKRTMSVPEMRKLLGIKKTESYWLVHKNYFKTELINGTMRVDIASFEKWYANQTKHKKVTGEKPGAQLCAASYSFRDVANMLGEYDGTIYDLWNRKGLPTVTVNYRKRIPREIFDSWYEKQNEYHKVDGPATIEEIEEKFILFREAAAMLKMSNEELLTLIRKGKYKDLLDMRMFDNKRWISRRGFQDFLNLHDQYKIRQAKNESGSGISKFLSQKQYISKEEAARIAGVSKSTVAKWALKGTFPCRAAGYVMRIERIPFLKWVDENRKVV
ncbi:MULTISPECIES: helix-turn-helix domain-containing protein [Hungatella]|jgi:predicted DNA-binding transcriptional regulator AlpA|uniref:helix-turn-helix domain-containing protein n=1 Tax=Hungatella TaxID=1649459 RepID=UPI002942A666|nr:helix-turn-helix domain-containing protein [uncultured Enterocloster sp.]